jgi:hypothetical protein
LEVPFKSDQGSTSGCRSKEEQEIEKDEEK